MSKEVIKEPDFQKCADEIINRLTHEMFNQIADRIANDYLQDIKTKLEIMDFKHEQLIKDMIKKRNDDEMRIHELSCQNRVLRNIIIDTLHYRSI
jgi:hypothetical protein